MAAADRDEDLAAAGWRSVGRGVMYQQINAGPAILIAYGGYSARLGHTAAWATALVDARLGAAGVGHVYAVQGPADPSYARREIANSALRAHLATLGDRGDDAAPIYAVAHSSGSFVAHELLAQLHAAGGAAALSRVSYANLDGGGDGLTAEIAAGLASLVFVYARDPSLEAGLSQNHARMRELAATYAPHGEVFEVAIPGTGCASGAGWSLHNVLITHRPHNPTSFDVANDYTDFADRPVTTEYLDLWLA